MTTTQPDEASSPRRERVLFRRLALAHFRNLTGLVFEPAPRLNLISGQNGHGKTSLIEALYVLATSRSFRSNRLLEVIQEGEVAAQLKAQVSSFGLDRELRAVLGARSKSFLLDGKRPAKRLSYALSTPVIVFHPGDLFLVSGPAQLRRSLLDRILVHLDPGGAEARLRYQEAQRERHKLLVEQGSFARGLDAYEQVLADYGARFAEGRGRVARQLIEALTPVFEKMGAPGLRLSALYQAGGATDPVVFRAELEKRRNLDARRGSASFGPHRDEIALHLDSRAARSHASQGQQRILTLALKIAELHCVRAITQVEPVLLLDDVSSELDSERTTAVFRFLNETQSQVFVTTTRPELFRDIELRRGERADFRMVEGRLEEG